jgi:hypothetical protein
MKTIQVVLVCLVISLLCSGILRACFSLLRYCTCTKHFGLYIPCSAIEIPQTLRQRRVWKVDHISPTVAICSSAHHLQGMPNQICVCYTVQTNVQLRHSLWWMGPWRMPVHSLRAICRELRISLASFPSNLFGDNNIVSYTKDLTPFC